MQVTGQPGAGRATQAGFTLAESLSVLMITSIVLVAGIPAFQSGIGSMRSRHVIQDAFHTIQHARDLAIQHKSGTITLCGSMDGMHCHAHWGYGWILFADDNDNHRLDADEVLYRRHDKVLAGELVWRGSGGRPYVRFDPAGYAMEFGALTWCPDSGETRHARQVTLNRPGRARLSRDRDHDGIHEDMNMKPLVCEIAS